MPIKSLLRGNASFRQNGINARGLIPLLEKELMGSNAKPLTCLFDACVLSSFHCHYPLNRTVLYVTIIIQQRTMIVKSSSDGHRTAEVISDHALATVRLPGN